MTTRLPPLLNTHFARFALLGLLACISGCAATPQEQLLGRWYNEATSIRFRPDGSVIYNSASTGLTTGRFYFDGELRTEATGVPVSNLTLDLVRGDRIQRWDLEVQFLGNERIRLQPVRSASLGRPSDGIARVLVLRKATETQNASVRAAP